MRRLEDIDWDRWTPEQTATLLFVRRDDELLMIRKKRGLGAGKVNGPGGRLEPGEAPLEAAIRETQEELRTTPTGVCEVGQLSFQFVDGLSIHCHVFTATGHEGEPTETDEAIPLWIRTDAVPYDEMWEDDRHWLPLVLAGQTFRGRFLFDGEQMLGMDLQTTAGG